MQFSNETPIYLQIADDIRRQILDGQLEDGDQVMSTTEYASTYRINPATAAKAFTILEAEGVVEKRRGLGVFVTTTAATNLRAERRASFDNEVVAPFVCEGLRLGLAPEQIINAVRRAAYAINKVRQE